MASTYSINSTFKLNSGYEIPRLGFGVRCAPFLSATRITTSILGTNNTLLGIPNVSHAHHGLRSASHDHVY